MRLLDLTNQPNPTPGRANTHGELIRSGALQSALTITWRGRPDTGEVSNETVALNALKRRNYDVCVVRSPKDFPSSQEGMHRCLDFLGNRTVVFIDYDAWGGRKRMPKQYHWWAQRADIVLSVAGKPQSSAFTKLGARDVRLLLHTYDHIVFSEGENEPPPSIPQLMPILIGNNTSRRHVPLSGLPGSRQRFKLAKSLSERFQPNQVVSGSGWPERWGARQVNFKDQVSAIRSVAVSVNWDHYPRHGSYASDRLPISMLAGRPHLTTMHPYSNWCPGPAEGFYAERSYSLLLDRLDFLLRQEREYLERVGLNAWTWASRRMSHRESEAYILRQVGLKLPESSFDTWRYL